MQIPLLQSTFVVDTKTPMFPKYRSFTTLQSTFIVDCSIFIFKNKNPSRISNERDFSFLEKQQKFFSKKSEMSALSTVYLIEKQIHRKTERKNKMKRTMITCTNPENGQMHFYVTLPTETVYLFSTKYFSNNIFQLFKNGVSVEKLFQSSRNIRRQNIQEHLIRNLKDIEKEYEIPLFQNSRKHFQKTSRKLNKAV